MRVPLLNFEGGPGSRGPGPTFTPCRPRVIYQHICFMNYFMQHEICWPGMNYYAASIRDRKVSSACTNNDNQFRKADKENTRNRRKITLRITNKLCILSRKYDQNNTFIHEPVQPPEVFCKKMCSQNFRTSHTKTPVSLFNKVRPATFIKKRLQRRCFPGKFAKFFRTSENDCFRWAWQIFLIRINPVILILSTHTIWIFET